MRAQRFAALVSLALLATMVAPVAARQQPGGVGTSLETDVPGRVADSWIVTLHPGVDASSAAERLANAHAGRVGFIYTAVLNGFSFHGSDDAAAALARNPSVRTVVANRSVAIVAESVPTGIRRIDADDVNGVTAGTATGAGARVAILDTGIDLDHEDLAGNIDLASGKNCIDTSTPPNDGHSHGTHVAGTVAAIDNEIGVIGVAPAATLIAVKVLDDSGSGSWASVICGIDHVTALNTDGGATNDVDVANMSLGGSGSATGCSDGGLHQAICQSVTSGTVYVVAAGNDSKDASGFVPAAYPEVLTVSAFSDTNGDETDAGCTGFPFTTCDEDFAPFSNFGSIVDVIAPGVKINSAVLNNGYGTKSGTSMAAPHAAGVAALVRSLNQSLTVSQVEAILEGTGQCPDNAQNNGDATCNGQGTWDGDPDGIAEPMVNAAWAVAAAAGGGGGGGTPNNPPVANDVSASGGEDTVISWTPSVSDLDAGATLTCSIATQPTNGSASVNSSCSSGSYTPGLNYNGTDSFTYRVSDGSATDDGTVSITINAVNDAPVAVDDAYSTPTGTTLNVAAPGVLANDSDVDRDAISAVAASGSTSVGGSFSLSTSGSFTYSPPSSTYTGSDSFTYTVSDGNLTDTGTVTISVGSVMTISSLTGSSTSQGKTWSAIVTITIADGDGVGVAGASVSGTWTYNGTSVPDTCITGSSGQCTVDLTGIAKRVGSVTFTTASVDDGGAHDWDDINQSEIVFKP